MIDRKLMGFVCTVAILGTGLLTGCSKYKTGDVQGVITLDGQPLENATVTFSPAQGRASVGQTDAEGRYRLRYTNAENGAEYGEHRVSITSAIQGVPAEGDVGGVEGRRELLPARYHAETELVAEVKPGSNTFDFALESAGEEEKPRRRVIEP